MPTHAPASIPCIVLGLESQIGLALVRELGRTGIRVIGITHDPSAIGLASRFLWRRLVVAEPRSPALIAAIRALGEELGPCCLLTVSEGNLAWLARNRHAFGQVRPVVPDADKLALVVDKQRTLEAARAVGIATPVTAEPASMQEVHALASSFAFPAVLKWKDPAAVEGVLGQHGLDLVKAEYVYSPQHLLEVARRYQPVGRWPMVQAYCPGQGLGQFFYLHQGRVLQRFQHVRVAEWPPEGGFSSVCDALPLTKHAELQELSIALLQRIGWEGVAMVEYRWDPATGRAVLMEINGRFWGSYPLAVHCQAGFGLLAYQTGCAREPMREAAAPLQHLRCRMVSTEIKRLVRILFQRDRIADKSLKLDRFDESWRFLADFLRPGVRYYVWSWSDPRPFIADLVHLLGKPFARLARARRANL